jgi:hypothetical protein
MATQVVPQSLKPARHVAGTHPLAPHVMLVALGAFGHIVQVPQPNAGSSGRTH